MVWTGLVHGLSCFATDFAERRDANFKGEFVAKYVPESTVSVETGRRKAGAEKSLLIPSTDIRPVLMIGRRDSEKRPAAGWLIQISDSKASKAHLLTGLQPHPSKRQQIRGGFNFGLTATKGLVFVLDGSFRGDRCRIERVSRK